MSHISTYYTYVVKCNDGSFYTGKTNNLHKRIRQHNGEIKGGAKYTRSRRPIKLIYQEEFETNAMAAKREGEIKLLTRKQKNDLCNSSRNHINALNQVVVGGTSPVRKQ